MIFHKLNLEEIVQVDDATRIDASQAFVSQDEGAITLMRISPDNGATWFDVTNTDPEKRYLDWAFGSDGDKTIKLEITTASNPASEKDFILNVISKADDCLFSSDADLRKHEPEILCFLRRGRRSFLDIHRCSQKIIIDWLAMQINVKDCEIDTANGCVVRKLTKKDLYDLEEVRAWSVYQTLIIIFEGLSNQADDVYAQKVARYSELMYRARSRSEVTTDFDQDGNADYREKISTTRLTRKG